MRLFRSLHFKLAATVISVVVLSSILHFTLDYRSRREQILSDLEQRSVSLSEVALKAIVQVSMAGRHTRYISGILEDLALQSSLSAIHILDKDGVVKFSSDRQSLGHRFSPENPACTGCHSGRLEPGSQSFNIRITDPGPEVLRHVSALPNAEGCHSCHGSQRRLNGILMTDFELTETQSRLEELAATTIRDAVLLTLCLLLIFAVFMHYLVIQPVRSLASATRKIGRGDFGVRSEVRTKDEIGQLAQDLDRMAGSLEEYKDQVEEKERVLQSLVARLVDAQEMERRNLSLELHDHLGQSMSALLLQLQNRASGSEKEKSLCAEVAGKIREQIESVRRLARGLHPSLLEDLGLSVALQQHLADLSAHTGMEYHFEFREPDGLERLPTQVELALYRIAQEALTNIVKHAAAHHVSLVILRSDAQTRMIVEDDGVGFALEDLNTRKGGSLGLVSMKERAALIGGSCEIESTTGQGTTVLVILPHHQEQVV